MLNKRMELWPDRHDVALYTFLQESDPSLPGPKEKLPAVILCPGGAYLYCAMGSEGDTVAMHFAAAGYQTFILQYTVKSTYPQGARYHEKAMLDLAKAILTVREHAEEWQIDVERIALAGFSAGAHLAGSMATRWHEPELAAHFNVDSACFRPMAAILGYGLLDYVAQQEYVKTLPPNPLMDASTVAVFGTPDPTVAQMEALSPCRHVSEKTPPIFMMHAANDTMVPAISSVHMAEAMLKAGRPYELHIFPTGEHGFATGVNMGQSVYRSDLYRPCSVWLELCKKWLLHIAAPETCIRDISAAEFFQSAGAEDDFFASAGIST